MRAGTEACGCSTRANKPGPLLRAGQETTITMAIREAMDRGRVGSREGMKHTYSSGSFFPSHELSILEQVA